MAEHVRNQVAGQGARASFRKSRRDASARRGSAARAFASLAGPRLADSTSELGNKRLGRTRLDKLALLAARASGLAGLAATLVAVLARLSGHYVVGRFESSTLLNGGIAAMVLGCLAYLYVLVEHRPR
jgi:hypothetical protein